LPCVYVELIADANTTSDALMAFAKDNIHQRAAHPKYVEILDELPKTAVGKVFKPDLRRRAITRIYDAALADAGLSITVASVVEDKKRGLVAKLTNSPDTDDAAVLKVLGEFTRPWEWAD
jgi:fatty-acyl-CoA synthase